MSVDALIDAAITLREEVKPFADVLVAEGAVDCIYNPLAYAWRIHEAYIKLAGGLGAQTVLLGMNPGPHGMGQMGIPFAATSVVRDLFGITGIVVEQPKTPHVKRPVVGLDYPKEEVSGTRLWGLLADVYGSAKGIFSHLYVVNHCPLMLFSGPRATNITPDKLSGPTTRALLDCCDKHLLSVIEALGAKTVIGVGRYAERRAQKLLSDSGVEVLCCWHPSPASPLANRNGGEDWRNNVRSVLPSFQGRKGF